MKGAERSLRLNQGRTDARLMSGVFSSISYAMQICRGVLFLKQFGEASPLLPILPRAPLFDPIHLSGCGIITA